MMRCYAGRLCAVFPFYLCLGSALSVPSQGQVLQQDSSTLNATILTTPRAPIGFYLDAFTFKPEIYQIEAQELWLSLVSAASLMAQFPTDLNLPPEAQIFKLQATGALMEFLPTPRDLSRIYYGSTTYNLIVWTLFDIGLSAVRLYPYPSKIPWFQGTIRVDPRSCGQFTVKPPVASTLSSPSNNSAIATSRRDLSSNTTLAKTPDSGGRHAPEDGSLLISWKFGGTALPPGPVLMSFLTAQTYFSEHESSDRGVNMIAVNPSKKVQLKVIGVGADLLTWDQTRIAVRTLWREVMMGYSYDAQAFVAEPRFEELRFSIEYNGVKIGRGSLSMKTP